MDATVDAVNLTAVRPGYCPIAQLYTDFAAAVDRAVRQKHPQPARDGQKSRYSWLQYKTLRQLRPSRGGFPGRGTPRIRSSCISGR